MADDGSGATWDGRSFVERQRDQMKARRRARRQLRRQVRRRRRAAGESPVTRPGAGR